MQTVPPLPLDDIEAAVSSGDCPAVFARTKIQFDRVAAVSSGSADDNVNCLEDAYAQPGLCDLTKQACCPRCTFAPDARPTPSHQHAQPSIPLHPRTPRRSTATHCCTCIDSPLPASSFKKVCHMFTDRLQMTNLFQTPANSTEPNCGAAGADFTLQFTAVRP